MSNQELIEKYLPKQLHPATGEPFSPTNVEINTDSNSQIVEFIEREPLPPERQWFDGEEFHELTEDEFVAATKDYERTRHG